MADPISALAAFKCTISELIHQKSTPLATTRLSQAPDTDHDILIAQDIIQCNTVLDHNDCSDGHLCVARTVQLTRHIRLCRVVI